MRLAQSRALSRLLKPQKASIEAVAIACGDNQPVKVLADDLAAGVAQNAFGSRIPI